MRKTKDNIETLKIVLNKNLLKFICWTLFNKSKLNVIWKLILNAFSKHMNNCSQKLRNKFANFEGLQIYLL